jgi:protein Mpv17
MLLLVIHPLPFIVLTHTHLIIHLGLVVVVVVVVLMLRRLVASYSRLSVERPYATNIVVGGFLWGAGDVISQKFERKLNVDWKRVARMSLYGFACAGPIYCWWYRILERKTAFLAHSATKHIALKVLADQVIFEVPYLAFFFAATSLIGGEPLSQAKKKINDEYVETYLIDCAIWPALQVINFRYVPARYTAAVVNGFNLIWISYLSYVQHKHLGYVAPTAAFDSHPDDKTVD